MRLLGRGAFGEVYEVYDRERMGRVAVLDFSVIGGLLVGRAEQLAQLDDALARASANELVAVCLHGASGVGRSALLCRFTERAHARVPELQVLSGRCHEREAVPAWVVRYNERRPHQALGYKTPSVYRGQHLATTIRLAA